jgi:hypothetical protein
VLLELISVRYERRPLLITANKPFGEWGRIFPGPAMTRAAVNRLVQHATIFEMNIESHRRRAALERKRHGSGRPANYATPRSAAPEIARDNQPEGQALPASINRAFIGSPRPPPLNLIVALRR